MKIYLIRHGETTGDIEDRYGGNYDDHMTERGKEQLVKTAESFVDKDIEVIFSSPLLRAKESAEIIKNKLNVPVEVVDGLQERHYGVLAGLTRREALEKYPQAVEAHKNPVNTDPQGESYEDFKNRVVETFRKITDKHYKTIAIVSHGGPIKQVLAYLKEEIPDKIGDGGVIVVERRPELGCPGKALVISIVLGLIVFIIGRDVGFAAGIAVFSLCTILIKACWPEQF